MQALLRRREFLLTGAFATGGLLVSRIAFAQPESATRFVFIILRGALDGLAAVPPYGDPGYAALRGELAIKGPGAPNGALQLTELFGLHPSLAFVHESYLARQAVIFHAIASPYRERSHFDGQDVLENGCTRAHATQTGWLNRALAASRAEALAGKEAGVALGQNVPLLMRGPAAVASWSPSTLAALDEDTLQRITDLYATDPLLSARLADALATDAIASEDRSTMANEQELGAGALLARRDKQASRGAGRYTEIIRAAASFLRRDAGPRVAVFDTIGWDTHANEGAAQGQLALRLSALDSGLRTLKQQLGPVWSNTAVFIATEFGRTAATNGTRGTDHGTGAAAFLVGGAVHGGRVVADWPGLSTAALYQGRDLKPTLDLRAPLKGLLADALQVPGAALERDVFPDSAATRPLTGLLRTTST